MKFLKWLGIAAGVLVGLVLVCAVLVAIGASQKVNQKFEVPAEHLAIPSDSASLARGAHLVEAVAKCKDCHRPNFGGGVFIDQAVFARLYAPNITPAGVVAHFSDPDWIRAIRHGVLPSGRGAIIMPADAYIYMSDSDLADVIAYVKSVPPVQAAWPEPRFGPVGKVLLAMNNLPMIPAARIDHGRFRFTFPAIDTTPEYGHYLARIGGCAACHNAAFSGGPNPAGPPDSPPPMNLTPIGLAGWSEPMFITVLRQGKKPDGSAINNDFMPWQSSGKMTDAEIHAIWLFLRSLPPKQTGES
ncbi:MAG TPA: cytochrome c [Gemmatimonadales bacterium]|jgi:mono/diheme cytochrome c family protein